MAHPNICPCWAARREQADQQKENKKRLLVLAWVLFLIAAFGSFFMGVWNV